MCAALPVAIALEGSRQIDKSPRLQLQEQRAHGHVLESPGLIAPLPLLDKVIGELTPRPLRMLSSKLSNVVEACLGQQPALHTNRAHAVDLCKKRRCESSLKCPNSRVA